MLEAISEFLGDVHNFTKYAPVEFQLDPYWKWEWLLIAGVFLIFFILDVRRWSFLSQSVARLLEDHRRGAIALCAVTVGLSALAALSFEPVPIIHDEFSYLLGADTFASGRWTNPTHPFWRHFETYHVLHEPSYQSKYLPLHAAFLALGKVTTGYFIAGVWLELVLGVLCVYWALSFFVGRGFAFLGAALLATRLCFSAMGRGFMGGGLAMAGGALVVGAAARIVEGLKQRAPLGTLDALALAMGIALLAHSRPYESCFLLLPILVWGIWKLVTACAPLKTWLRLLACLAVVGVPALTLLLFYNCKVTGAPLVFPYNLYDRQYIADPILLWHKGHPDVEYRHATMEMLYGYVSKYVLRVDWQLESVRNFTAATVGKFAQSVKVLGGLAWLLLLVPGLCAWRRMSQSKRFPVLTCAVFFSVGLSTITYFMPYYVCPVLAVWALVAVLGARSLIESGQRAPFAAAITLVSVAAFLPGLARISHPGGGLVKDVFIRERSEFTKIIRSSPGKQLVFVVARNVPMDFWLFNEANIDDSQVVWARSMDKARDRALVGYFSDRNVWMVEFLKNEQEQLTAKLSTVGRDVF